MSPSPAYYEWLDAGEPYALALPVRQFVDLLRSIGFTVYHKGDTSHMQANPPEDHTPFSATGWPISSKRWIGHALDIMPDGAPISLQTLARRIIRDRDAMIPGTRWVKYLNWTDDNGICHHESWANATGERVTTSSTDKGHIHISARSDMDTSTEVADSGYNPTEDPMSLTASQQYIQHVLNHRVEGLITGKNPIVVPPFTATDGSKFPGLSSTNAFTVAFQQLFDELDAAVLAAALATALETTPAVVDALATALASRIGMIPSANEIAKAVGNLNWHGNVGA